MNFCHYVILKIILGEHDIIDEKFYGKIFTSFLNFITIEKLLIADYYNLVLFTINTEVKKIFAKSSILIKYKYSLLKQKYEENQDDILLKEKIFENISQFGNISKNFYFIKYIKEEFCNIQNNDNNINNRITLENELPPNFKKNNDNLIQKNNENVIQNKLEKDNNNLDDNKIDNNIENNNDNNENGFFSSIKFALGFGGNNSEDNKKTNKSTNEKVQIGEDSNL